MCVRACVFLRYSVCVRVIGWLRIFSSSHEILVCLQRHIFPSLPPPTLERECAYVEEYDWLARIEFVCVCLSACFVCSSFGVGVRACVVFTVARV